MSAENVKKEELFTEEMVQDVAKELGLSAEENERISRIREILNGTNLPEPEEISPDTVMAEDYDSDLFTMVEKESEKINLIDIAIDGIKNKEIPIEELLDRSRKIFPDITEDDLIILLDVAKRYRDNEDFSVYNALPKIIQDAIKVQAGGLDRSGINLFAKLAIEELCTEVFDMTLDKEAIDFNEALKEALDIPDITQLYEGFVRDRMEKELVIKADALEKGGFSDGAAVLRRCSQAFTDSYTFSRLREALTGKTKRKLYKDNEFYNRYCNEFNAKNASSKFKITDVYEFGRVLDKMAPAIGIDKDDVLMLVILFCKTCQNYDPNDTADGVFMYYTIRNVLNMEHHSIIGVGAKKPDEFDQLIIDNIASLVNDIHMIVNERRNN